MACFRHRLTGTFLSDNYIQSNDARPDILQEAYESIKNNARHSYKSVCEMNFRIEW